MTHAKPARSAVQPRDRSISAAHLQPFAGLRRFAELFRVWRTRSRERSDLFKVPESVASELNARGMDVAREAAKPFWQP